MIRFVHFQIFLLFLAGTLAYASNIKEIKWEDLIPALPEAEDPLAGLSDEKVGLVEWIIYLKENLPKEVTPESEAFQEEMEIALPVLEKEGIFIDEIIKERNMRNSSVNEKLNNKQIQIAGYLLPLDLSGEKITDFLLVPTIGACIHVPPPPPNQIIHAVSVKPISFKIENMFLPVTITGKLKIQSLSKELYLVDGSSDINIGYSMSVDLIEDYKQQ